MENNTELLDCSSFLQLNQRDMFPPAQFKSLAYRGWPHPLQVTPASEARNTNRLTSIVTPSPWELKTRFLFITLCGFGPEDSDDLPGLEFSPQNTLHQTGKSTEFKA